MNQRYANTSGVPLSLAVFLATDHYDHNDDPYTISATTLLKPLRQIILGARVKPEESPVDLVATLNSRMGTAIHDGIERAWKHNAHNSLIALGHNPHVVSRVMLNPTPESLAANPDCIPVYQEQRLQRKLGKWTVTGKFDMIVDGMIEDFKTASVWSYKKQVNADKQTQQGSIYRWLDNGVRVNKDQIQIVHIFMDWRRGDAARDPQGYPQQPFKAQLLKLMSVSETEAFIRRKLELIEQYWDAPEDQIPECSDEDLWRSEPVYKYYADPAKAALGGRSTKNFDSEQEALVHVSVQGKGTIVTVPGVVKACNYCGAFNICTQKDRLIASGDLPIATTN